MAWIESHSVLVDHRKVRECASLLGIKKVYLLGHLHAFWHKVIELAEDGDITSWTVEDIAYYAQWEGDPQQFYSALNGRFIDERLRMRNESGLKNVQRGTRKITMRVVHDWLDYAWRYLYGKYHTSKPELLEEIKNLYTYIGNGIGKPKIQPTVSLKGNAQVSLPTKPTIPNQPNQPKHKEGANVSAFVLPDWIRPDDWTAFEEMRKKIKKPMTDRARENIVKKLATFKARGHDPTTVLNNSITGDWQDVYEPKPEGGNGKGQRSGNNQTGAKGTLGEAGEASAATGKYTGIGEELAG